MSGGATRTRDALPADRGWTPARIARSAVDAMPLHEAPQLVRGVVRTPGRPLTAATRASMEAHLGGLKVDGYADQPGRERSAERAAGALRRPEGQAFRSGNRRAPDFSSVRVHADARADESAWAVGARAYTVGDHVVFGSGQFAPASTEGRELIAHELAHVLQQRQGPPRLMRAPTPDVTQPRTFIVVYGSGQLNPSTVGHNVGALFQRVAAQKVREIKARLGQASKHTIVFEYTPTEAALKAVLNRKYPAPVAEVHVFSHGWAEGANLGGPVPPDVRHRPTELPSEAQERRLTKEDLGKYKIEFADDAAGTFYGCNIGNVGQADYGRTFAREFSEEFGVPVTASTRSTHFDPTGGWHQVPDPGGTMREFTPTPEAARAELGRLTKMARELRFRRRELAHPKKQMGLIGRGVRESKIEQLEAAIARKRPIVRRLIHYLPAAEQARRELEAAGSR